MAPIVPGLGGKLQCRKNDIVSFVIISEKRKSDYHSQGATKLSSCCRVYSGPNHQDSTVHAVSADRLLNAPLNASLNTLTRTRKCARLFCRTRTRTHHRSHDPTQTDLHSNVNLTG